jgi:hypothetical protein
MPKMTKAQQKRMVKDILKKTKKLYMSEVRNMGSAYSIIVNNKDVEAVERMCSKWMKRIG